MGQKRGEKRLKNSCGEESLGDAAVAARGPADLCPNVTLFIGKFVKFPIKFAISNTELRLRRLELLVTLLKRHPAT